jgi:hypothetical protein
MCVGWAVQEPAQSKTAKRVQVQQGATAPHTGYINCSAVRTAQQTNPSIAAAQIDIMSTAGVADYSVLGAPRPLHSRFHLWPPREKPIRVLQLPVFMASTQPIRVDSFNLRKEAACRSLLYMLTRWRAITQGWVVIVVVDDLRSSCESSDSRIQQRLPNRELGSQSIS